MPKAASRYGSRKLLLRPGHCAAVKEQGSQPRKPKRLPRLSHKVSKFKMIRTFQGFEREDNEDLFRTMFRQRKEVFYDQKNWDVKISGNLYEIDELDRDDSIYFCVFGDDSELLGSARILNTAQDHLASKFFGDVFKEVDIRSPTIWEITRLYVKPDDRIQPNGVSRSACELILGIVNFGIENGISQYTAIYEAPIQRMCRKCGITYKPVASASMAPNPRIYFGISDVFPGLDEVVRSATGLEPEFDYNRKSLGAETRLQMFA